MIVKDKVIFIARGNDSIGEATGKKLSSKGATVFLGHHSDEDIGEVLERAKAKGVEWDWGDKNSLKNAIESIIKACGRIDVLVNNLIPLEGELKPFMEISKEEMGAVFTHIEYTCDLLRSVFNYMVRQKSGKIINLIFYSLYLGTPLSSALSLYSGAILGLSRILAMEMGRCGIRVNCVSLGIMEEFLKGAAGGAREMLNAFIGMQSFKRYLKPEDIANTIWYLSSASSDFFTGQSIIVDGGMVTH